MRTPTQAIFWELWRTSRFELLVRIGFTCGLILLMFGFSSGTFAPSEKLVLRAIVIMMLTTGSAFSMTWLNALESNQKGFSFHLGFARPTSTAQLVVVPMLYTVVTAVVCFVLPALLFCLLMGTSLPLVGLGAGLACVVTCLVAVTWSPTTTFGRVSGLVTFAIGLMFFLIVLHARHNGPDPWLFEMGKPGYFVFAWPYYFTCLVISAVATVVTIASVERQRHGGGRLDGSPVAGVTARVGGVARLRGRARTLARSATTSPATKPFTNRFAAQCWFEMRRVGRFTLPFAVLAPLFPLVFVCVMPWMYPDAARSEGLTVVWLGALVLCPFVYQIVGVEGALGLSRRQGTTRLSAFDATRSMPNDELIAIKLLVIAACSLIGWLCMALAAGLHSAVLGNLHVWAQIGEAVSGAVGDVPIHWWAAGLLSAALLYMSSSSMFIAIGMWIPLHEKRFICGLFVLLLHPTILIWDARHDWAFRHLWGAYGYFVAVTIVIVCVIALRKALAAGYLGKRLFGWAFCLWLIYVFSIVAIYTQAPAVTIPPPVSALGISMLLVPLASTAIAPLALASYRHG